MDAIDLPPVTVVIPTYGRPALVTEVVAAVLGDTATSEVIVVSDGPSGPTREVLARFVDPRLRLLEIDRPRTY